MVDAGIADGPLPPGGLSLETLPLRTCALASVPCPMCCCSQPGITAAALTNLPGISALEAPAAVVLRLSLA